MVTKCFLVAGKEKEKQEVKPVKLGQESRISDSPSRPVAMFGYLGSQRKAVASEPVRRAALEPFWWFEAESSC
jgi:hypothetical protein